MTHPLPPHHPLARHAARNASRAQVMTLVADLSVIDRIEAALSSMERPRRSGGLLAWLLGRR